jgi:aminocarboxymuconate-semialdehyde decarboxylase
MSGEPRSQLMPTIDMHAHLTPRCLTDALSVGDTLHGLEPKSFARGLLRALPVEQRLSDMDHYGVDVQVVSAEPQMYCYDAPITSALPLHRECNDEIAAMAAAHPDRFRGLAILPMQDVASAIEEMTRAVTGLGMVGVMIGDHVGGRLLDEPDFRPFWATAQRTGALVLLHQASPTLVASRTSRYHLPNTIGNAVDRTIGVASLIFGGVLDEFPDLRICLSHAGGYSCFAAGRLDWGHKWRASAREHITRPPSSYLPQFFYDCITHDERALRFVVDTVGIDQVVFGSDYPGFAAGKEGADYDPKAWLTGLAGFGDDEKKAILEDNPARLLGLPKHP